MMTLRKKILLIVGSIILAIIVIVLLVVMMNRKTVPQVDVVPDDGLGIISEPVTEESIPKIEETLNIKIAPAEPVVIEGANERYIRQLARIFTERIGTYSNQNDNQHIDGVASMTTATMQKYLASQSVAPATEYSGVTTRVISSEVQSLSENIAVIAVGVQQEVRNGGAQAETVYKNGRVNFSQEAGEWKVSGLYWD